MSEQTPRERVMALIQAVVPCSRSEAEDVYLLLSDEGLVPQTDPLGHVQVGDPDPCGEWLPADECCPVMWELRREGAIITWDTVNCTRTPAHAGTLHIAAEDGYVVSILDLSSGAVIQP